MKKILFAIIGLALGTNALAQFAPNTVLTAAALNNALAAPTITAGQINGTTNITTSGTVNLNGTTNLGANTNAVTQNYLASSNLVATAAFVRQSILASQGTIPVSIIGGGGTYNFASIGTGAIFGVTTSSGAIATVSSIVAGGSGYQVGDCLVMQGGNGDAVVYVTGIGGGGAVTTATVLYGGTNYSGTPQLTGSPLPPGSRTGNITGTLTSNATIIVPAGTFLAGARRFGFQNNTTGNFTVTIKLSNGAGGSTGTGVVLPQGTANSTSLMIYTNGVTDLWPEVSAAPNFVVANSLTVNGVPVLGRLTGTSSSIGGGSLASGTCASTTVSITGATTAMSVNVTPVTNPGDGFYWKGYVSAPNTVTVSICAVVNSSTPTASTYNVRVLP